MVNNDTVQMLLAYIPGAKLVADNRQILCRCPKCGDSPNYTSAHFYIGPLKDDTKPLSYHCKLCETSGILDTDIFREFGIFDYELMHIVVEHNKEVSLHNPGGIYNYSKAVYTLNNTMITESPLSQIKLNYINERLGLSLTYDDIIKNKIVLNISDIFEQNIIPKLTRHPNIVEQLDKYFIGFLSYDNCFLNMRRLCSSEKVHESLSSRYINYNIFNKMDNNLRFYVPPTTINLIDPTPVHVYVVEGPFDALSVKMNICNPSVPNIVASAGGKSYLNVIKFIIGELGIINMVIHLCPDGDVESYKMYNIANYLSPFNLDTNILRNGMNGEKDFGVPSARIELQVHNINSLGRRTNEKNY